jgi:hypothetical protein
MAKMETNIVRGVMTLHLLSQGKLLKARGKDARFKVEGHHLLFNFPMSDFWHREKEMTVRDLLDTEFEIINTDK